MYEKGTRSRVRIEPAKVPMPIGRSESERRRHWLIMAALPSHIASSASAYVAWFMPPDVASLLRPDIGCGKARVGVHGCGNIMCSGMPSASAQWMWPKVGGLAMTASATKGLAEGS